MKKVLAVIALVYAFSLVQGQNKFTDERDGNVYNTITIDGTTWMKENLRFRNIRGAYYFDNDTNNISKYGVLYEWKAAMKACPEGWHLPSGQEYRLLANHFENSESWGKSKVEKEEFNIQLGGQQDYEGIFSEMDESGYYWTSTEYDRGNAEYFSYLLILEMHVVDISRKADIEDIHGTEKSSKYSVRCAKTEIQK